MVRKKSNGVMSIHISNGHLSICLKKKRKKKSVSKAPEPIYKHKHMNILIYGIMDFK